MKCENKKSFSTRDNKKTRTNMTRSYSPLSWHWEMMWDIENENSVQLAVIIINSGCYSYNENSEYGLVLYREQNLNYDIATKNHKIQTIRSWMNATKTNMQTRTFQNCVAVSHLRKPIYKSCSSKGRERGAARVKSIENFNFENSQTWECFS